MLIFIILVLFLSIPAVQTQLGSYATKRLNDDFKTNINIGKIGLRFNGDVELKEILIRDYKKDTLISASEINTSIISFRNVMNGKLNFGDIHLEDLIFNIKTYEGEDKTNLDVFVARFDDDNPRTESSFLMSSSDVSIYNGSFRFLDENKENEKILEFNNLNINATNFLINGSDVNARINTLGFVDSRGLVMKNMSTNFKYTLTEMVFDDLEIETQHSILNGNLRFDYNRSDFVSFADKVKVTANFKDSDIALNELNTFYNEFGDNEHAVFSTKLSGTLNDLTATDLRLNTSSRSKIYGDLNFKNLFNSEDNNFSMAGDFTNLTSTYRDLRTLLPNVLGASLPSIFNKLGVFVITGKTNITTNAINADLNITTDLGFIKSNLKIVDINNIDAARYKGNVIFDEFKMGKFLNDKNLGKISANLDVDGVGFKKDNLNSHLKGDVYALDYNKYTYQNIAVDGKYEKNIFNGKLISKDKNLKLEFNGLANLSKKIKTFDFVAMVDYANLRALNLYTKDDKSIFSGTVDIKMQGTSLDDAVGDILFNKTTYKNEVEDYYFEDFAISSRFVDEKRFIRVNSPDIIEGAMSGVFKLSDIDNLFENSIKSIYTSTPPNIIKTKQYIDFNFKIYNKIIEVFYPELNLGANTFIKGRVENDEKEFKFTFKSPKISILDYFASDIEVQVDNKNPLFNTYIEIDSLNTKFYKASKFNLINVTLNDTLFMRTEFKGGNRNDDKFDLSFYHTINENDNSVVGFKRSEVIFKNNSWKINEKGDSLNKIEFDNGFKNIKIEELVMNHLNEEIKLSGALRDSTYKDLKLNFKNVDLQKITPRIDSLSLAGKVNGKLDLLQKDGVYMPNSAITIEGLEINRQYLGSFDAKITGNNSLTNYKVNAKIKDDVLNSFEADGDIDFSNENSQINLDLLFNKFSLNLLSPLLEPVLYNVRGDMSGKATVTGDLKQPSFNGDLTVNNGGLGISELNVDFDFQNKASVTLNNQSFVFNNVKLTDTEYQTKGVIDGTLSHTNFSKWKLDLTLNTDRLLILNTKYTDESLYYGTGFIGGYADIKGPTEALRISAFAETKKGTEFYIPLNDLESFGDNSFIHFLTPEEKIEKQKGNEVKAKKVTGLELDFELDVTNDALIEIVMDRQTGSSIKGRGVGSLLFNINTNGKFNMYGDFVVWEGSYNFLFGGFVQKEFTVKPYDSSLQWNGDPLNAQINIKAIYKTRTNPSALLDNPISQTIPVNLEINLTGQLEKPEPNFQFEFPNVSSTLKSELNYRLESKEDRDNQALYLLATGTFNRQFKDFNVTGTLTERLNGLVNGFFSDSDSKINIGLNYEAGQTSPDYQSDDRLGVTLQTKITDRVLINGKVGVPVGGASESVIAGDVQIDFLLNADGTLTATVFNRENSIRNFGEEIGYTQGLGVSYSVDFDTFGELIRKVFNKKDDEAIIDEEDENTEENSENKTAPLPEGMGIKEKE